MDLNRSLAAAESVARCAQVATDPALRRLLLKAGCDLLDRALKSHSDAG